MTSVVRCAALRSVQCRQIQKQIEKRINNVRGFVLQTFRALPLEDVEEGGEGFGAERGVGGAAFFYYFEYGAEAQADDLREFEGDLGGVGVVVGVAGDFSLKK